MQIIFTKKIEDCDLLISDMPQMPAKSVSAGVVFQLEPHDFLLNGMLSRTTFRVKSEENNKAKMLKPEVEQEINGNRHLKRRLSRDEQMTLMFEDSFTSVCIQNCISIV